ncbi:hypothetical protein BpHYR1_014777 [Brachionus plicatilis]|uniref:Uncharacterized protein n=1 Tax=Brachionus plicatilis TaxID=10195 RepID=A0A3M7RW11_BRAPC|nr:hypothetical protein BpHYR1_014777 [Brachionus plicatilis]
MAYILLNSAVDETKVIFICFICRAIVLKVLCEISQCQIKKYKYRVVTISTGKIMILIQTNRGGGCAPSATFVYLALASTKGNFAVLKSTFKF